MQLFELSDDHRSRRRLQSSLAVASGSASRRRPGIRDRHRLLNLVRYLIAVVARWNLADVELQYLLAGATPRR
jgi:hypothetical protein